MDAKRPSVANPVVTRRTRLAQHIGDQLALVGEAKSGTIAVPRFPHGQPTSNDPSESTAPSRRPTPWWWMDQSGTYFVCLRYARRPIELAKGKTAVKCASLDDVEKALIVFKAEALKGSFDSAMAVVAQGVRSGFGKAGQK